MSHRALAAARPSHRQHSFGRSLRDRVPSIIAATLLVIPVFVAAASLPRPALGDAVPTLVFTSDPTSIVAGGTSGVITVQRQDGAGTPTSSGSLTVDLSTDSETGVFRNEGDTTDITSVVIPDTQDTASFRYTDTNTAGANLTASDDSNVLTSATQAITVTPGALDHFMITVDTPVTAGTPFGATATAYDKFDNVKTDYDGSTASLTSTLAQAPDGTDPSVPTVFSWGAGLDAGIGTASLTATKAEPNANETITVTDDSIGQPSDGFSVLPAELDHFTITTDANPATAGTPFGATATAFDTYDNVKFDYDGGTASLDSTLSQAPDGTDPTVPTNFDWGIGPDGGIGTASLTPAKAEAIPDNQTVTVSDGLLSEESLAFSVLPGPLDHFTVTTDSNPATAGTPFGTTATAYDAFDNVKTNYTGSAAMLTSTLGLGPDGSSPSQPANFSWGSGTGIGTASLTAHKAEPTANQTVTVTDGTSKTSAAFSVLPGPLDHFTVTTDSNPATAGTPFGTTATAFDQYNNVKTDYTGSTAALGTTLLIAPNGTPPTKPANFTWGSGLTAGVGTASLTPTRAEGLPADQTVTVTDGSTTKTSAAFSVLPGPLHHFTITTDSNPATAGTPFGATATAFDVYNNVKTNYGGGTATLSTTLLNAPDGTPPTKPANFTWGSGTGVGIASLTPTRAEPTPANQTVTVTDGSFTKISSAFSVLPGPLHHFTLAAIGATQMAGTPFAVTATAYDQYNNIKTNYAGGAIVSSSTLAAAPGFPPALGMSPSYGAFLPGGAWTTGTKSANVTAFKAEPIANQTATVTDGGVTKTSNSFKVVPAPAASIVFNDAGVSFNGEPYDTKKDTPIYSNCVPTGSGTPPCDAGTSTGVKVLVRDLYGNMVSDGTSVTLAAPTRPSGSTLAGTKVVGTTGGVALFGTPAALVVTPTGTTGGVMLTATAGSASGNSRILQLVDDLEVCANSSCDNVAKALAYGRISAGTSGAGFAAAATLNGVTLTTQQVAPLAKCAGQGTQMGATTDIRVQGFGVSALRPKFTVALIVPKSTLNDKHATSRNAGAFNICLGTTWDGGGEKPPAGSTVPVWKQKQLTKSGLIDAVPDTLPSPDIYWGWIPDCSPSLPSTNPCIAVRTKDASVLQSYLKLNSTDFAKLGFKSGDLGIVYLTQTPWDAKGSVF